MKHTSALLATFVLMLFITLLVPVAFASASGNNDYWCYSYWSSNPCSSHDNDYDDHYKKNKHDNYNYDHYSMYDYSNYWYNNSYNNNYSYNNYPQQRPTCSVSISAPYNNYGYGYNQPFTISWWSQNAYSAYLSGVGNVPPQGSYSMYPGGTMMYTLTVYGQGGTNTCYATYYQQNYQTYTYQYPYQQNYQTYNYQYPQYNYPYMYSYNSGYPYGW